MSVSVCLPLKNFHCIICEGYNIQRKYKTLYPFYKSNQHENMQLVEIQEMLKGIQY